MNISEPFTTTYYRNILEMIFKKFVTPKDAHVLDAPQ